MGPLGDLEDSCVKDSNLSVGFSDVEETQQIECETPPDLSGETQPMDLFGETQLMDLEWGTQLLDVAGETQVLDDADYIEVISDTQILSQDSLEASDGYPVTMVNRSEIYSGNERDSISRTPSGSVFRGFTSIRTASMRAFGLAARARGATSWGNEKPSLKQLEADRQGTPIVGDLSKSDSTNHEDCIFTNDREKQHNKKEFKSNTKRKLFTEDRVSKACRSKTDINHTYKHPVIPESHDSGTFLAGLSYANSEEPGELSQVMALEAVDRFLEYNVMEYGPDLDCGIHSPKEANVVSAKGSRDLAKSSILKNKDGECRAYDWDDTCEDEGGGDFFQKKRELFFVKNSPKAKFFTEPRTFGDADLRGNKTDTYRGIGKKAFYTEKELGDPTFLDSGLVLHKMEAKKKLLHCGDEVFQNDLTKDLSNVSNMASGQKLPEDNISNDLPDLKVIGPDTQIAVEAMETLCYELHLNDNNVNGSEEGFSKVTKAARKNQSTVGVVTRSSSLKHNDNINKQPAVKLGKAAQRKRGDSILLGKQRPNNLSRKVKENRDRRYREKSSYEFEPCHDMELNGCKLETNQFLVDQLNFSVPVASRTRKGTKLSSKSMGNKVGMEKEISDISMACLLGRKTAIHDKSAEIGSIKKVRKVRSIGVKKSNMNSAGTPLECVTLKKPHCEVFLDDQTAEMPRNTKSRRSRNVSANTSLYSGRSHANHSTDSHCTDHSSIVRKSEKILLHGTIENGSSKSEKTLSQMAVNNESLRDDIAHSPDHEKVKEILHDAEKASTPPLCGGISDVMTLSSAKGVETKMNGRLDTSPSGRCGTPILNCNTPTCATSKNDASPICMGNEYYTLSCRRNLSRFSLTKEVDSLISDRSVQFRGTIELRKRKDNSTIRVLFSQHLDVDVAKQQKKILTRLGASDTSSMLDATHFVADEFVRTRNMLEAIAFGRPVVTHLWLESCGQTNCFVNEKNYILRDARKEKEFGFCMPVSLSRACQHPLLLGQKVLVTQNTKPGKDTITNLVKAVHGLAVERLGRSSLKDEKFPDDLLILSCEEDYDVCIPFLEKGCTVYSSELLLNGIVKQKLEFERYRLFTDQVRKTRSTIWVKKNQGLLHPTKC